jgi:hypothetical protein
MSTTLKKNPCHTQISEIQSSLDGLSLQLLRDRFLEVNVEAYLKAAEVYIQETLRHDKIIGARWQITKPLETLIRLSIDKIASAYVLISREADEKKVNALLSDYEIMVESYLEKTCFLA